MCIRDRERLAKLVGAAVENGLASQSEALTAIKVGMEQYDERLKAVEKKRRRGMVPGSEDATHEGQEFSVGRITKSLLHGDRSLAPMEWEMSDAARGELDGEERYAQDTTVGTKGGFIVPNAVWHDKFIEKLRPRLITEKLGANTMDSGGVSVVEIPIETSVPTTEAVAENAAPATTSEIAYQNMRLEGHAAVSYLKGSRKFFELGVNAESRIRSRMLREIGITWNTWALKGTGADGEPRGLANSIPSGNGVAFGSHIAGANVLASFYEGLLQMEEKVAEAEALDGAVSPGWAMGLTVKRAMRSISSEATTGVHLTVPHKIFSEGAETQVLGYPFAATSLLDSTATSDLIFGDFDWMTIVTFGNLTLEMTTEADGTFKARQAALLAAMEIDVAIEQPTAFSFATGLDVTGI
jgi:HK97 family phage major capsid protein